MPAHQPPPAPRRLDSRATSSQSPITGFPGLLATEGFFTPIRARTTPPEPGMHPLRSGAPDWPRNYTAASSIDNKTRENRLGFQSLSHRSWQAFSIAALIRRLVGLENANGLHRVIGRFAEGTVEPGTGRTARRRRQPVLVSAAHTAPDLIRSLAEDLQPVHHPAGRAHRTGNEPWALHGAAPSFSRARSAMRTGSGSGRTPRQSSNASAACSTSMPSPSSALAAPASRAQRQNAVSRP